MNTGIHMTVDAVATYKQLSKQNKFRYMTFKIVNENEVIIDRIGDIDSTFAQFYNDLPQDDARYGIYMKDMVEADSIPPRKYSKLFYIKWTPEQCDAKNKMLYALSTYLVKKEFVGVYKEIQAGCYGSLEELQSQ